MPLKIENPAIESPCFFSQIGGIAVLFQEIQATLTLA
jgi:hypothetical protein